MDTSTGNSHVRLQVIPPTANGTADTGQLQQENHADWNAQIERLIVKNPPAGLYMHIPFCFHKCHYCDFYSIAEPLGEANDRQAVFCDRLIDELTWRSGWLAPGPVTIFAGGGTPTYMRVDLWQRLLRAMRRLGLLDRVEEFTVEANPETVTPPLAQVLAQGGVNRVSIGCQSFDPGLLKTLERWHDPQSVARAVAHFRQAGISNINLDLIHAIPGQTLEMVDADLDAALALGPVHVSHYALTYEPNTAMTQRLRQGQFTPVDDELARGMYQRIMDRLATEGFEHYEISNWSRRSEVGGAEPCTNRCRHNMLYWSNGNWLGVGPAAASHVAGHRWKNDPHLGRYLDARPQPAIVDHENLSSSRRPGEQIMLRLRLRQGITLEWIDANLADNDARLEVIDQMIGAGLLEKTQTHLRLTRPGLFVADAVISRLL